MLGDRRLIVRRTRLVGKQAELFPDWRHHPFLTNRSDAIAIVEAEHRQHAVVELVIRDLKDQALAHFPSGDYDANSAWTVIAALGAQPAALDRTARRTRPDHPRRPNRAPQAARDARPPDDTRRPLDTASARPLALAAGLQRRAHTPSSAPRRRLSAPATPKQSSRPPPPTPARSPLPANTRSRPPSTPAEPVRRAPRHDRHANNSPSRRTGAISCRAQATWQCLRKRLGTPATAAQVGRLPSGS